MDNIFIHGVPVWCEVKDELRSGRGIIVFAVAPVSQVSRSCEKTLNRKAGGLDFATQSPNASFKSTNGSLRMFS